jgi:hypothetical protein
MVAALKIVRKLTSKIIKNYTKGKEPRAALIIFLIQFFENFEAEGRPLSWSLRSKLLEN